jgi:hypothetical protein
MQEEHDSQWQKDDGRMIITLDPLRTGKFFFVEDMGEAVR